VEEFFFKDMLNSIIDVFTNEGRIEVTLRAAKLFIKIAKCRLIDVANKWDEIFPCFLELLNDEEYDESEKTEESLKIILLIAIREVLAQICITHKE
jgi:hypothetical protein